jgi:uncharacterized protein involved in tolerance to divalent cations
MAMFAVSSRFAVPGACKESLLSPIDYARRAQSLRRTPNDSLCIDEIKACTLLCIYNITESGHWESVSDVAKLARMAELYHVSLINVQSLEPNMTYDAEEWRSVWWSIYTLDTVCSAIACVRHLNLMLTSLTLLSASSHSTSARSQEHMELPALSVSEFTNSLPSRSQITGKSPRTKLLPAHVTKHWKTIQSIFSEPSVRSRNLHLGVCSLMRAVTELRSSARYGSNSELQSRLSALESDFIAVTFALPPYVFNPARHFDTEETADEHQSRLNVLLLLSWLVLEHSDYRPLELPMTDKNTAYSGRIALKLTIAKIKTCGTITDETERQSSWQNLLSEANEVISILKCWKPEYFEAVDPLCSFTVFFTACVLVLNDQVDPNNCGTRLSEHVDLALLFLGRIGQHWPIGAF